MFNTFFESLFTFLESSIFLDWRFLANQNFNALPHSIIYLICFILSACVGSFINVVVHRLPLIFEQNLQNFLLEIENESNNNQHEDKASHNFLISLSHPPSQCPHCQKKIQWYDNIPIISWLILKAKCRNCNTKISSQYFFVEIATGLLAVGVSFFYLNIWKNSQINSVNLINSLNVTTPQPNIDLGLLLFLLLFLWQLIAITLLDAKTQLMPNELTQPLIITGLLFSAYQQYYNINWFYQINSANSIFAACSAFL